MGDKKSRRFLEWGRERISRKGEGEFQWGERGIQERGELRKQLIRNKDGGKGVKI